MRQLKNILSICGIICVSFISAADNDDAILSRFDDKFRMLDSLLLKAPDSDMRSVRNYSGEIASDSSVPDFSALDNAVDARVNAEISEMKNVTGLSFQGQIYGRLDDGFDLDEEDALSRYKGKVQAEVRWNFLQNSVIGRKGMENEIKNGGEIDKAIYRQEKTGRLVGLQKERFRACYDSLLFPVLSLRIDNLSLLSDVQLHLLSSGAISFMSFSTS